MADRKIKTGRLVLVEGKYDRIKLDSVLDALIIPVNGFSIFSDTDRQTLIKTVGSKNGIVIRTDSDTAGFRIRKYIQDICAGCDIIDVYIPSITGKEPRKVTASKEGTLGVEGMKDKVLLECFERAGLSSEGEYAPKGTMTYSDLYELGLSGGRNSRFRRFLVSKQLGIPAKLSKKAFLEVLNRMTDKERLKSMAGERPVLFWDYHGTLTKPDNQWLDIGVRLCKEYFPEMNIADQTIIDNFYRKCLPWFTYPDRDTRHLVANDGWWRSCEEEFVKMYMRSGLSEEQAKVIAPLIRPYVVDSRNHFLHDDAISTLRELTRRGYRSYMISNNYPEVPQQCKELGIDEYMSGYAVSALVGYDKPRRELFDYARHLAGDPRNCVMIGDNPTDDMKGAKDRGFTTILVNNRYPDDPATYADFISVTLTKLLDILE